MAKRKNKAEGVLPDEVSLEAVMPARSADQMLADRLVSIAQKQIQTSVKYKEPRTVQVSKSEDLYNGKVAKALKGRWNVPLPIMSGFIDTLLSKIDDPPKVRYGFTDIADMQRAAKIQAKFDEDSGDAQGQWNAWDRAVKKVAAMWGVGIYKYFAYNDSEGNYHSHFEGVDPLDFECEPLGGQFLKKHSYMGQRNIFKYETDLEANADAGIYDAGQVAKLKAAINSNDAKTFEKLYFEKTERLRSLGFNPEQNNYVGVPIYNLTEWYMVHEGVWYYLLLEPHSGVWVRFARLSDIFSSGVPPFIAWHTHPDAFNFWSKAPADDMRPVAEAMNIAFNQMLDAREKNVYRQRAYDPEMIDDPAELEWRPDGLVKVNTNGGTLPISSSLYEFKVEGMTEAGTISLMTFVDQFVGGKLGVTNSAEGAADEKQVGIYYGNLQQIADRLGLYNKAYSEAWAQLGWQFYFGLRDHIKNNRLMVKMIGDTGYNWVELVADDTDPEQPFNVTISGGQAEMAQDEVRQKKKANALALAVSNPLLSAELNSRVVLEELFKNSEFKDDTIRRLMDKKSSGSEELLSEAHQAIQTILAGEKPKLNRGATELYVETIIDFALDSEDLDEKDFDALIAFAQAHVPVVMKNMIRKAMMEADLIQAQMMAQQTAQGAKGGGGGAGGLPAPTLPPGTADIPGSPTNAENVGFMKESLPPDSAGVSAGHQGTAFAVSQ